MAEHPKILVIRFSSIGDIVLATPVIRTLNKQLSAEVHLLTKRVYSSLLENNPYLSKIYSIDNKVNELSRELSAENYDYIIDLHKNLRSVQVRLNLRKPAYSFDKLNVEKFLLTRFGYNKMPDIHIVDRYIQAAAPLGITNDGLGLDFIIDEENELVNLPVIGDLDNDFIAFSIGATHATKRMPREKMLEICKKVNMPVALIGGKDMSETGEWLQTQLPDKIHNSCGKLSIGQSASVIKSSNVVLTHDTGMMHIAAALQKPIVSVWGNTVPEFGMYPYYGQQSRKQHSIFEVEKLSCRPCSKIGYSSCPKGHFKCMNEINIDALADRVNELML